MNRLFSAAILFLIFAAGCAGASAGHGLEPAKLAGLRRKFQEAVDRKEAAGIAWGIGRRGHPAHFDAAGLRDLESKAPMLPDTICRIASMTKPITALAILLLEDDGK